LLCAGHASADWRAAYNVREAEPLAVVDGFVEPDAVLFLAHHPRYRGALLASDGRLDGASQLVLLDAAAPARRIGTFARGAIRGLPKSVLEDDAGRLYVADGLNEGDDPDPTQQRVRVLGPDFAEVRSIGTGLFRSVNGLALDGRGRLYANERSQGVVRRFDRSGAPDGWELRDPSVRKMDNMLIAEDLTVAGARPVILLSDEARRVIRFYALADARFLGVTLGNAPEAAAAASLFGGSVEGMVRAGDLLIVMDEGDENGGTIWFFDLRDRSMLNQPGAWFAGRRGGLIGGIHKGSPWSEAEIARRPELAGKVPPGTFLSADGLALGGAGGRRLLAVANQALHRIEVFDLDALLATLGARRF
jgi:hypothetical protein